MAPLPPVIAAMLRVAAVAAPIFGRALVDAYRQAMINAAANGAKTKGLRGSRMSMDEAAKILNVKLPPQMEEVAERHKAIFEANDPKNGGSVYIQSKVELANRILMEKFAGEAHTKPKEVPPKEKE
mmetsp:Transcript_12415/g.30440  ORF Transcript_12415/g.30440 Transcript_12415/m.30440 type:complete len:126 (+) Transcript_12415:109-486(+)|eukprot:CAMPEP_0206232962 /NCGR_PEP_ID=MMETSP0047_2-20121206/11712_1 /ASSEMBLY_ACC=CAM_ASM_000192 /TAXON_ID=195065 /ORGANISM="Chroomonas mesostigmatica_cf, Strain CCMP1168" /LENGTH=125 /DNA_ID=CAMNT_0053656767 /DNA_START=87 /DNA_END=464 /DNA_ORIENTATION=-